MFRYLLSNICLLITLSAAVNAAIIAYGVCTNPRQESGICIQIKDCDYLYDLLNKTITGINVVDVKLLKQSQCGYDNSQDELPKQILVCCPDHFRNVNNENRNIANVKPGNILPKPGECGKTLSTKIHGGNVTKIDEFPWMVLLQYKTGPDTYEFNCGGSLINSRYILTAGHCLKQPDTPAVWEFLHSVRLGEWNLTTNPDYTEDIRGIREYVDPYKDILVDYAIVHPSYVPTSKDEFNDIAIIRMAESVPYSFYIKPICLPQATHLRNKLYTYTDMDVAGWGATENNTSSAIKLKIVVNIWNITQCQNIYRTLKIPINEHYQLCAGGESGIDTCRGDSGGPLMAIERVKNRDVYFVIGVVSFGPKPCGLPGWPGVYARVGNYTDWIVDNLLP